MIDLADLRQRPDAYKTAAKNKRISVNIDAFLQLDARRRALVPEVEAMRKRQNEASKTMPAMKGAEKEALLQEMKALSSTLKEKESELEKIEGAWQTQQFLLPQLPHSSVPVGKDETENVEASRWGDPDTWLGDGPPKSPKDHIALGEELGIIDIERGVKIAGARSYVLKGAGALLHQAVIRFTIDHLVGRGWTLFQPPYLARYECFQGTGFFPGPDQANIYAVGGQSEHGGSIEPDDLHLIGTSEVSVCSYHGGETLPLDALPTRYAGYSPCFRREAGTYGKDTHGLYRIHQFEKVEQVVLCEADEGKAMAMFEEIRTNAEDVLRALRLPYRVLTICTGDMGKGKVFMQDIETWMPSRKSYGETHSCSYLGDFQARRLNITYKDADGKKRFVHTLNNTCIASPRILIPILEMYQNADGSITIPEVLRPYMGGANRIQKQ